MVAVPQRRRGLDDLVFREGGALDRPSCRRSPSPRRPGGAPGPPRAPAPWRRAARGSRRCPSTARRPRWRRPCVKRFASVSGSASRVLRARVLVDFGGEILDVELAAEVLAEERDVGADDRTEVDEDRRLVVRERADELRQRLRRNDRLRPLGRRRIAVPGSGSSGRLLPN